MDPLKVMFARFPGGGMDRADVTDWLVRAVIAAKSDKRIDNDILNWRITNTPITMGRNQAIVQAKRHGADILCMVDNDMSPDLYLEENPFREATDPSAKPFFESSFDFLFARISGGHSPAVVAAPYCGPSPHENCYVFLWRNFESNVPESSSRVALEGYTREEAAKMRGIKEAAALPTGLMLIDMRAIEFTDPPYFYYEWEDETESMKASTEDVTFTRDPSLNGVPQFCNWDSWAGHWKPKRVGRPVLIDPRTLNRRFRNRVLAEYNIGPNEELVFMEGGKNRNGQPKEVHVGTNRTSPRPGCETESVRLTET
jgi:hypothetical protein